MARAPSRTILITGGAGFVGSNLAVHLARQAGVRVLAADSLKRRGAELNLGRLRDAGVSFAHADIRCMEDLESLGAFDVLVDCSAEPAVLAAYSVSPLYVIQTNLSGTVNCLECARRHHADIVFVSSSRVYPVPLINSLGYHEGETRFMLTAGQNVPGVSEQGFSEALPLTPGHRSLYGATKLAAELLIQEYGHAFGLRTVVNRCGIIAGPWQMGKVDQGVVSLWLARHLQGRPLSYVGFGGTGKQVRDVLHIDDLCRLVDLQLADMERLSGSVFNVGGGAANAVSLRELTTLCRAITGATMEITAVPETHADDIRYYVTDNTLVRQKTGWKPAKTVEQTLQDIHRWMIDKRELLAGALTQ